MEYNEIMNYIHRDEIEEKGQVWNFRKILSHSGPFKRSDPDYNGSSYNVQVEWENGEITYVPLNIMIQDDKVTMAQYAMDNDLINLEGWKGLKKLAKRDKIRKRLINQAKLRSYRRTIKYVFGL